MPIQSIPITLDRERHVRYPFNSLCLLEDVLHLPISDVGQILMSGQVRMTMLRALLYAGLADEDPKLTEKHVGELLNERVPELQKISEVILQAFNAAFSQEDDGGPKKAEGTNPLENPGAGPAT